MIKITMIKIGENKLLLINLCKTSKTSAEFILKLIVIINYYVQANLH